MDLPFRWSESTAWMDKFMTDDQPFLTDEAEQARLELIAKAKAQKREMEGKK